MLKTKENLLMQSTKKFLKLIRSNGKYNEQDESRLLTIASHIRVVSDEIVINYVESFVMLLKFLTKTTVYYPNLVEKFIELAEYFPKIKLEAEGDNLTSKVTEYLCLNFYVSMFALIGPKNAALPEQQRLKLQAAIEKSLQNNVKAIFECMQTAGRIPAYKKGLIFGIMKGLGQCATSFSEAMQDFMVSMIDSVAEDSLRKPKNRVALIFGIIGNFMKCQPVETKKWSEDKSKRFRTLAQAHISHQLKQYKCPNMLFTCFRLLCNDFLAQMAHEKRFLLSFAKAKPDAEFLASTVRDIVYHYPLIRLTHIKRVLAYYVATLQKLYEIIPLSISHSLWLLDQFVSQWVSGDKSEAAAAKSQGKSAEITQIFETAVGMLMRFECLPIKEGIENTATYKQLIQELVDLNGRSAASPEDALKGLQYVLDLLLKVGCEPLTTKVLLQLIPSSGYVAQVQTVPAFGAFVSQFARLAKTTTSFFAFQQALLFLCNLYRNKVGMICTNPAVPPMMTYQIANAFTALGKDTVFSDMLFQALSELFVSVALTIAPHISSESHKPLAVNLYFLVRPLYQISKRNKQYLDFDSTPHSDTSNRYFTIWQHIVLHNEFKDCARSEAPMVRQTEITAGLQKLAVHTPPLVFHCGRNVRGYLKYEPAILALAPTAVTELEQLLSISSRFKQVPSNEECIYAYVVLRIFSMQIAYLNAEHDERMYRHVGKQNVDRRKCMERIPLAKVSKKYVILPGFFAYLFDSGVQYLSTLLDLFTALNSYIFSRYFGTLTTMQPSGLREMLTIEDVKFLLKANCNLYSNIRTLSMQYVRSYVERFPFLLTYPEVLFTFLDIVGTLYNELYFQYDSLSHILRLPHSAQTLILPVEKARKQDAFKFLIKLLEELYIKGAIINETQLVAVFQEYVHRTISSQTTDSLAHFGLSFFQNLYANYKNFDSSLYPKQPALNYLANLSEFNQQVEKLIAQRSLSNTINELIDKASKIQENIISLDASKLANSFKSLLTKSAQYSQLKTKYYGVVKGYLKNFKGIMSQPEKKPAGEKTQKDDYTAQLARRIGVHLLRKLKKTLEKHLRIQLSSLKNPEPQEEEEIPESTILFESEVSQTQGRRPAHRKAYAQLRSLVIEERSGISSKPQKLFDLLGQLTALLIICKEKSLKSLSAFEDELFSMICYVPSCCLTREITAAGVFCWSWLSNLPLFSRELLYLNLSYSLLAAVNAGGIFDSQSIQSALIKPDRYSAPSMDQQSFRGCPDVLYQKVEEFIAELSQKTKGERLSTLLYSSHYYYSSRNDILEGLNVWLRFLANQLKTVTGSNTQYILNIYNMVRSLLSQPLSSKSKRCALDLQVRFRIFNLALTILATMRFYKSIFKGCDDTVAFQYQAYLFIWQYFGNKNKFCTRNSGELLQNDIDLIKETLDLLNADTNMTAFCTDGEGAATALNESTSRIHGFKGTCRFSSSEARKDKETYRTVQSPVYVPGAIHATIEVQETPPVIDRRYYSNVYECLHSLMVILSCELINELKAWNTGSIKQKRASIQKTHYKTIQSDEGVQLLLSEALKVSPQLAIRFVEHLRSSKEVYAKYLAQLSSTILLRPSPFYSKSRALSLFIEKYFEERKSTTKWDQVLLRSGLYWTRPKPALLINYLSNSYERQYPLHEFVASSLELVNCETIEFNLAQLFQCLRTDTKEKVFRFLMRMARKSRLLCHKILWMAKVEGIIDTNSKRKVPLPYPSEELPALVGRLSNVIMARMSAEDLAIYIDETDFFQKVTEISGTLKVKEQTKAEKKSIIQKYLEKYNKELETRGPLKPPIYLITSPHYRILRIQTDSGLPMQSAERCPIMVTFWAAKYEGPDAGLTEVKDLERGMNSDVLQQQKSPAAEPVRTEEDKLNGPEEIQLQFKPAVDEERKDRKKMVVNGHTAVVPISKFQTGPLEMDRSPPKGTRGDESKTRAEFPKTKMLFLSSVSLQRPRPRNRAEIEEKPVSCIFKAKDDVRQDTLSLQIIRLFQDIFKKSNLDLFLYPYATVSNRTGENSVLGGILECIPNCSSRDQLGKAFDSDLYQYFIDKFGQETTAGFQSARKNFIKSLAAYSLVSYILQIKDRHNGNILIDNEGHVAHIDFGFIFDWSPGRDMRFESANFKLTSEMIKVLGGDEKSEAYNLFVNLTIKGFLAIREYYDVIIATIYPMFHSGQPCFKLLLQRFRLELNSSDAAKYIKEMIWDAHNKLTTRLYDKIQEIQNNIYH